MILDSLLQLSDAQALTATAVSTNVIDLSVDRNIGKGEPMAIFVSIAVDADTTTGDETYQFAIQTATDEAFTAPFDIITSQSFDGTTLTEGHIVVLPIGHNNLQYLRLNSTLGGTTPSVTINAYLQPMSMIDGYDNYAPGYTIV